MHIVLRVEDLLLASWEADFDAVARVVPEGAEPAEVGGRHLVSVVSFHVCGGRVGPLPAPPFSQLTVRTYVTWKGEPAVLFLASRVTAGGLPGAILGAPYRLARLRVRTGRVDAPGLGFSLAYDVDGEADPGALGRHELGIFQLGGVKGVRIVRGPARWQAGRPRDNARADLLLAYGFSVQGEPELVYASTATFETAPAVHLS